WMGITETQNLLQYQRDLKEVSRFGDYMLYETPAYHPAIYSAEQIIITLGDRNILHSILEIGLPIWKAAIIPIETTLSGKEILERSRIIVVQGGDPTPLQASLSGVRIRPWEGLELSSNPSDAWYAGGAAWWLEKGGVNSAPYGFAITTGENTLSKKITIPRRGNYFLFISIFSGSSDSKGLEVTLGGYKKIIRPTGRASTDYIWEALGPIELEEGEAYLNLRGLGGLNAVSTIYLISLEGLEDTEQMVVERAHTGPIDIILLMEEDSWFSEENSTLIFSPLFSGGSAIRFYRSLRANFTTLWEEDYFILAKLEGQSRDISMSIDGILLKELKTMMGEPALQVYGPVRLRGGIHSIEISSRGGGALDLVAISTSEPSNWLRTVPNRMSYSGNPTLEYQFLCTRNMLVVHNIDHLNLWLPEGCRKLGDPLEYGALYIAEREGECVLHYTPFGRLLPHFTLHIAISSFMLLIGLLGILREKMA
ncbi:MAG: hypothetical protein QW639_03610, partial [Candidatus Bathyarchaeia archaeon]